MVDLEIEIGPLMWGFSRPKFCFCLAFVKGCIKIAGVKKNNA